MFCCLRISYTSLIDSASYPTRCHGSVSRCGVGAGAFWKSPRLLIVLNRNSVLLRLRCQFLHERHDVSHVLLVGRHRQHQKIGEPQVRPMDLLQNDLPVREDFSQVACLR